MPAGAKARIVQDSSPQREDKILCGTIYFPEFSVFVYSTNKRLYQSTGLPADVRCIPGSIRHAPWRGGHAPV
jgi:hypothetical protein